MTFNPHKCSDTKSDVIQYGSQAAALSAFDQALLFKGAMIHLNPPRTLGGDFPPDFSHLLKARRPVFRRAVCGANPKYFDLPETLEPDDCSITACQSSIRDGLQTASVDVDLPVGHLALWR